MSVATTVSEKLSERVGIPLSTAMLEEIRACARQNKRKYLDEIRHLIAVGLQVEKGEDWRSAVQDLRKEIDLLKARASPPLKPKRVRDAS